MAKKVTASAAAKAKASRRAAMGSGRITLTATQRRAVYRSAKTGRFVTKSAAGKSASSATRATRSTAKKG